MVLEDLGRDGSEVSLLLTDNNEIRALNRKYLNRDKATDVLSFPTGEGEIVGDIVISVEKAAEQAMEQGVSLEEEVTRLLVHGILHLFGYEHEQGGIKAKRMREGEERLMKRAKAEILKS